jgi:WD40 repeat protein
MLVTADDEDVIFWDLAGGRQSGEPLEGHSATVMDATVSLDGTLLASAGFDQQIILWDTATRIRVGDPLQAHTEAVSSVAFSPDGTMLASAGYDNAIILWDVASRTEIGRLESPANAVWKVAFSPDGTILASGGDTVMLWTMDVDRWEAKACQVANRNLSREEWRQYVGTEEYHATCPGLPVPAEPPAASEPAPVSAPAG